jgi:hypothetical protein
MTLLVSMLLLLPLVVTGGQRVWGQLRVPNVQSGDEPHYLVMIHSLIRDRDLDLANNYRAARRGAPDAGRFFAGRPLDHHTVWFIEGVRVNWSDVFDAFGEWDRDAEGHPRPRRRPGATVDVAGRPEYSTHPAGLPMLLAPVLAPFGGTPKAIEPLSLVCTAGASLLAFWACRRLLRGLGADRFQTDVVSALTFLGTPLWHYARSLYTEPYLAAIVLGASWLSLCRGAPLLAGSFVGVGMLMKPPFGLVGLPLTAHAGWHRDGHAVARLLVPVLAATGVILWQNTRFWGSPWASPQPFVVGNLAESLAGLWFGGTHGILASSPLAIAALVGWPYLLRQRPRAAVPLGSVFVLYLLLIAFWAGWAGGHTYGPRLLVPVLPVLLLGILGLLRSPPWNRRAVRGATWSLAALSVAFNAWAALDYSPAFGSHAVLEIWERLGRP